MRNNAVRQRREDIELGLLVDPKVIAAVAAEFADGGICAWIVAPSVERRSALDPNLTAAEVDISLVSRIPHDEAGAPDLDVLLATVPPVRQSALSELQRALDTDDAHVRTVRVQAPRGEVDIESLLPASVPAGRQRHRSDLEDEPTIDADAHRAVADGPDLFPDPHGRTSLSDLLRHAAAMYPDHGIRYYRVDDSSSWQSYPELYDSALRIAGGLGAKGLRRGDRLLLQVADLQASLSTLWGCLVAGVIPVPMGISPSYTSDDPVVGRLRNASALFDGAPIVADAEIATALGVIGMDEEPAWTIIDAAELLDAEPAEHQPLAGESVAITMLTSGSTGVPKAVPQTNENLVARSQGSARMLELDSEDTSFNWMAFDHVASLFLLHFRDVWAGMSQVHAPTELILDDPLRWMDFVNRHRVNTTFAPNFAFGLVNEQADGIQDRNWDLSCMRRLVNGGEAIGAPTARRFMQLLEPKGLPATAMTPVWGMSETSSGVTYSLDFHRDTTSDDDQFVCVGGVLAGVRLRIVDETDVPVAEGTEGRLQITGATVFAGYHLPSGPNRADFTEDGWFTTGDLGMLIDQKLTITGREKDVVIINGANYYSHDIETAVEELPGIATSFTAAVAIRTPNMTTDALAVFFVPTEDHELGKIIADVRQQVIRRVGIKPNWIIPVEPDEIPKTTIGKIQRTQLGSQFMTGVFDEHCRQVDGMTDGASKLPAWFSVPVQCPVIGREAHLESNTMIVRDTAELVTGLAATTRPDHVVFAVQPAPPQPAWAECLQMIQALAQANPDGRPVRLSILTPRSDPATEAALGLARSASYELAWLTVGRIVGDTADEISGVMWPAMSDITVGTTALRRELAAADLNQPAPGCFHDGGSYVITGGLGEMGTLMAKVLVDRFDARLLLTGRRSEADLNQADRQVLASLGDTVSYAAVDIADSPAVLAIVNDWLAMAPKTQLDGLLHLAGTYHEAEILDETVARMEQALSAKLGGAASIDRLLEAYPGMVVHVASSVNGTLGGYGVGAYAASNAGLDAWCANAIAAGTHVTSVAWSLWDDVGMSRGFAKKHLTRARGFDILLSDDALQSWEALWGRVGQFVVGLDDTNWFMAPSISTAPVVGEALEGFYTGASAPAVDRDSDGHPIVWTAVDELPQAANGSIDDLALDRMLAGLSVPTSAETAGRTPTEQTVARLWTEALGIAGVGLDDNLFDLGGDSMTVAKLARVTTAAFDRSVSSTRLYEFSSVRALAAWLDIDESDAPNAPHEGLARGAGRRGSPARREREQ